MTYNEKVQAIDEAAQSLVALIEDFVGEPLDHPAADQFPEQEENERIIRKLDQREEHSIDEDFTYKRPHGFVLLNRGHRGLRNWTKLYERVCAQLSKHDPDRFQGLPDMDRFVTARGNRYFARESGLLRTPRQITSDVYAETHFSANGLRDRIRELLDTFDIPENEMKVYLRQDRDA